MTRLLTEKEIDYILDFIDIPKHIPLEIAMTSTEINKKLLTKVKDRTSPGCHGKRTRKSS